MRDSVQPACSVTRCGRRYRPVSYTHLDVYKRQVEEMTVSINHVGDRAHDADRISTESGALAKSGEEIIGHTVENIHMISTTVNLAADRIRELVENSQQISNVIVVIKEVADQTNLLALNAAIEAARAGEQGLSLIHI